MVYVSVVMPALNEEKGVGICIDKIREVFEREGINGEIIVVDNGSKDRSGEIARERGAFVVKEEKKGYGNAYIKGFKYARGKIIILGDADNSYDFYDIPRFIKEIEGGMDFVIGNRQYEKGSSPWLHRKIGRPMFSLLLRKLFGLKISDSHCGYGAIRKDKLEILKLESDGMEFASEILIKAKKSKLKIGEIKIDYSRRIGYSKLRTLRDGARHLRLISQEFMR